MTTIFTKKTLIPAMMRTRFSCVHFIGIGGIGMSGLAEILLKLGYKVQGSDKNANANTERLAALGGEIFEGQQAANVEHASLIVRSTAIRPDNPELVEATKRGIPVIHRSELLAALMQAQMSIAVTGTHGKTTTTAMVGHMMLVAQKDPTIINGGVIHDFGSNVRLGSGDVIVAEADESDRSFLRLPTTVGIVTNMDPEHLEFYDNTFDVQRACYKQFLESIPHYGVAILCADHPEVDALSKTDLSCEVVTYGFSEHADIRAINVNSTTEGSYFDVEIGVKGETFLMKECFLSVPGRHNVQNALAAVAAAGSLGVSEAHMKEALSSFKGVKRRFTKTGEVEGISFIDDYAHHPVEVAATLQMARQATKGKVIALLEPHKFTRLHLHFDDFAHSLKEADSCYVKDVFTAGESPIEGVDAQALVKKVANECGVHCEYVDSLESFVERAAKDAKAGDIVICLGAGDSSRWAYRLPEEWKAACDMLKQVG